MKDLENATEDAREAGVGVVVVESDLDGMLSVGGGLSWYVEADEQALRNFASFMHKPLPNA